MLPIQPIVLCGGSGTRLWPLSNPDLPKQFVEIGGVSLLQRTIDRISKLGCNSRTPILVMREDHSHHHQITHLPIVYEKFANDTAVAVARVVDRLKEECIVVVLPSDHFIENDELFVADILTSVNHLKDDKEGDIHLFGIRPSHPDSKYGYIVPSRKKISFIEKPSSEVAKVLIEQNALWNSGIFVSRLSTVKKAIADSPYNIRDWVENSREGKAPSFDVAVLQRHSKIRAVEVDWEWKDVGTWRSILELRDAVPSTGDVVERDNENVDVINRSNSRVVVACCKRLLIVVVDDKILVVDKDGNYDDHLRNVR